MPLASSTLLTPHFTARELGADQVGATAAIVANLRRVAGWLEAARGLLMVPLVVTSGFRTIEHNAEAGGSPTSDHPNGLAGDFEAVGLTPFQVYQRLDTARRSGALPPFDQLIYYAADDHLHVGLGSKMRGQVLIRTTEGSYVQLATNALNLLRGWV